jgi:hypothetical protein
MEKEIKKGRPKKAERTKVYSVAILPTVKDDLVNQHGSLSTALNKLHAINKK